MSGSPLGLEGGAADVAAATMRANGDQFRLAESIVTALAGISAHEHVALYAQATAHWGSSRPGGAFAFPALEESLAASAKSITAPPVGGPLSSDRPGVLHVATEIAYPEGGHSRLIERWARLDNGRQHSLVTTSPRSGMYPALENAIDQSGGVVYRLAPGSCSFLRRAEELRAIAARYDFVVLHVHAFDTVAPLALEWPGRPPTIKINHDGHLPWLGRGIADIVACGRPSALELCVARRGLPRDSCMLLPVPAEPPSERGGIAARRELVRSHLGIETSALLLLTIASEYKFRPFGSRDLRDLVAVAIGQVPRAIWLVVGPATELEWQVIEDSSAGRVKCLGVRSDLPDLFAAADIYLDSWPFTSQTSLLDAASAGLPLIAANWHSEETSILGAWGGPVGEAVTGFSDAPALSEILGVLGDDEGRRRAGDVARSCAEQVGAAAWRGRLETIYAAALARVSRRRKNGSSPVVTPPAREPGQLDVMLAHTYRGEEPWRAFINWHRDITNYGSSLAFPGDEASLAETSGLGALVGQLALTVRDFEACLGDLRAQLAKTRREILRAE